MAYAKGPYEAFTSLPVPPRPLVNSARKIDFATKRYVMDATTGGFARMPPTAQRVVILVELSLERAKFNTIVDMNKTRQLIRGALKILTDSTPPLIKLKEVNVGSEVAGSQNYEVVFTDLTKGTGIDQSVQLT